MHNPTSTNCIFSINDFDQAKRKVLNWIQKFDTFCFLDNHRYPSQLNTVECLAGGGAKRKFRANAGSALTGLQDFISETPGWYFGHLGYDLKNEIENLDSSHPDGIGFPDLFFFEPEIVIRLSENEMMIEAPDPGAIFAEINAYESYAATKAVAVNLQSRLTKKEYIDIVTRLKQHILRGDCYEINFCQEFFAKDAVVDPLNIYIELAKLSPNPFSVLYRMDDRWLICASPERFLKKENSTILSQPIKGTLKRTPGNDDHNGRAREELYRSAKDRSENVMVVDLVRNDLAKICREGTVKVDELYGIYSFPQVHQMISTVSGLLKDDINFAHIIRATFPMGSMTGAPKRKVLELIEKFEQTRRGIFSGAVGYISPAGDFDLNVVIRSIMYNAQSSYLSVEAGSGITFYSDPENEWEECLVKATAMMQVLAKGSD